MTKTFAPSRKRTIGFVSFAVVLATSLAFAAPPTNHQPKTGASTDQPRGPGRRGHDPFARWDSDKDGKLTLKELPEKAQARLTAIDQNRDGILTQDEFAKGRELLRAERQKRLDSNHDGQVTAEERKAGMRERFTKRFAEDDLNHDGFLVQTEVPARWDRIKVADSNADSKVTLAELQAAHASGKLGPPHHCKARARGQGKGPR